MRSGAAVLVLLGLAMVPLGAQGRGRSGNTSQGIPPGHLPPPGECRVWYDDRPAGHQPPPTTCREAERVAARDRYARVIYGDDRSARDDRYWGREHERNRERAIPRRERYPTGRYPDRSPYPDRYPYPEGRYPYPGDRGQYGDRSSVPFDSGYKDGYDKGQEDARDNDSFDPVRHSRYHSADRGYNRRYGTKEQYKEIYREGFRTGYEEGYRGVGRSRRERSDGRSRFPWPF